MSSKVYINNNFIEDAKLIVEEELKKWASKITNDMTAYRYEESLFKVLREMCCEIFKKSIPEGKGRESLQIQTTFGEQRVPKDHILCHMSSPFKASEYFIEKIGYIGQATVLE